MRLHTVYRTTGVENRKARPEWYSKELALQSYLGALAGVDAGRRGDLVFVVDGPMVDDGLARRRDHGAVVQLDGVGNSSSYRWALALAFAGGPAEAWAADDLVYFAEDDYLYTPGALGALVAAAVAIPEAAFLTPYDAPDYYDMPVHRKYAAHHTTQR